MLTARITGQGAGQENTKRPRLPLLRQKTGKARSPRGCPGQGKTNLRPPRAAAAPTCPSAWPCVRGCSSQPQTPSTGPRCGSQSLVHGPGSWAAGDVVRPGPTGGGRWGRELPPPACPGPAPASSSQALPGYRQLSSPQSSHSLILDSMPFGERTGPSDLGPCFLRSQATTWARSKTPASSVTSTARHPRATPLVPTPSRV